MISAFYLFSGFLGLAYAWLLFAYWQAWRGIPMAQLPENFEPQQRITVLIPARNEAGNIQACLKSILIGNYPDNLLEIIVLDDFSEDETVLIVQQLSESLKLSESSTLLSYIRLEDQLPLQARCTPNKKKALALGVARAKGAIIVTTDADCLAPKNWLRYIASAFENPKTNMICAPVMFHREQTLLQRFQSLDFLGMMGITGAGIHLGWHYLANGANLAFRKEVFEAVEGYAGNEHLASGDDLFLVQKVAKRWPGTVVFLKNLDATVQTVAAPNLKAFWQQRLRWGTKNAAIPDWPMRLSLLTVFLFCWSIWINLAFVLLQKNSPINWLLLFQIGIKGVFDFLFLSEMSRFFKRKDLMRWFLPSFFLHAIYIPLIGTLSLFFKKYTWKGRVSE